MSRLCKDPFTLNFDIREPTVNVIDPDSPEELRKRFEEENRKSF